MPSSLSNSSRLYEIVRRSVTLVAFLSVAVWYMVSLMKTDVEPNAQTISFIRVTTLFTVASFFLWIFNFRKIRITLPDVALAGFVGWYLICYCLNDSIAELSLFELCYLTAAYVSLRILFSSSPNAHKWILVIICICGIIEAVAGIRQGLGMKGSEHILFKVTGTFFNPGPYGGYIATVLSVAIAYVVMRYDYASRIFSSFKSLRTITLRKIIWAFVFIIAMSLVVFGIIVLPSTMSRAAFVAVAVAVLVIFGNHGGVFSSIGGYFRRKKMKSAIIGAFILVLLCGGAYFIYALKKDSADGRLLMWKISAKVMLENPVKGVGPGYFKGAYGDMQAEYFRTGERSQTEIKIAGTPEFGFNEYLRIGAETGLPGLFLFLFVVLSALARLFRPRSYYSYGLIALLVFAFFSYPFSILPLKVLFVLFLAAAGSSVSSRKRPGVVEISLAGALLVGCATATILLSKPYADRIGVIRKWKELQQWYEMDYYKYVVEDAPAMFPVMKENPVFLFAYGRSLNMEGEYEESLRVLSLASRSSGDPMIYNVMGNNYKALGRYDEAAETYLKAFHIIPHRMYPIYLLAKLYSEAGDHETSHRYALQVIEMAPKITSPATREMQAEMQKLLSETNNKEH